MAPAKISFIAACFSLIMWAGGAFAKGSGDDDASTATHHYVHSHRSSSKSEKTSQLSRASSGSSGSHSRHSGTRERHAEQPAYVVVKDKHGRTHRVARASEPVESPRVSKTDTKIKRVLVVVRDKHGRTHKVYREVTVSAPDSARTTHRETKRVAVMVRDRHGRMHKVFKTEVVQVPDERRSESASTRKASAGEEGRKEPDEEAATASKQHTADVDNEPKGGGEEPERMNPSFGKAYALYDEGANARVSGNYPLAISCLGRALSMVPANSHGGPSVLQLNMEYELAQSAEAHGDMTLAARYYSRALSDRPNFTEAAVRLATVLARGGNYPEALRAARSAVQRSPNDPRTHAILTVLLEKTGAVEEARAEKVKTKSLMANVHTDAAPLVPANTTQTEVPATTSNPAATSDTAPADASAAGPATTTPATTTSSDSDSANKMPAENKSSGSAPEPGGSSEEMR